MIPGGLLSLALMPRLDVDIFYRGHHASRY